MGCETGNCPPCKIEVGAIYIAKPKNLPFGIKTRTAYHLFIIYTEGSKKIVYRGGPEYGNRYSEAAKNGKAQEFRAKKPTEKWDVDYAWGMLITHRMEGITDNYDYISMIDSVKIAEGPDYCGLDDKFTDTIKKIGELGLNYNPINAWPVSYTHLTLPTKRIV